MLVPVAFVITGRYDDRVTDPTDPRVKGAAFVHTLDFIDARFGKLHRERVLARLSAADREIVGGLILPIGMYPLATLTRLLREMDAELGSGDLSLAIERGTWAATRDMKTTHRLLLKFMSPQWVIAKGTSLWKTYHTTGYWESSGEGNSGARAVLHDLGVVDEAMCATLKGWIIGLLTMSGAKNVKVMHRECRAHGGAACAFQVAWT